jgi:MarR family 2-MHQ and catechol resistance regulon transcriptional repressor
MPTKYQGTQAETETLNAFIKLVRSTDSLKQGFQKIFDKHNLTAGQFGVLEILLHLGPLCQKEIGKKLFSSEGNITQILDNLEKRQLIKRKRNEDDRRYITVQLAPNGKKIIEPVFAEFLANLQGRFTALSGEELRTLGEICKKIGLRETA